MAATMVYMSLGGSVNQCAWIDGAYSIYLIGDLFVSEFEPVVILYYVM